MWRTLPAAPTSGWTGPAAARCGTCGLPFPLGGIPPNPGQNWLDFFSIRYSWSKQLKLWIFCNMESRIKPGCLSSWTGEHQRTIVRHGCPAPTVQGSTWWSPSRASSPTRWAAAVHSAPCTAGKPCWILPQTVPSTGLIQCQPAWMLPGPSWLCGLLPALDECCERRAPNTWASHPPPRKPEWTNKAFTKKDEKKIYIMKKLRCRPPSLPWLFPRHHQPCGSEVTAPWSHSWWTWTC